MRTFRFRFSKTIILLQIAAMILAAAAIVYTAYRMATVGFGSASLIIQYVVLLLFGVLALVIFSAMLIRSVYVVGKKEIVLRFGLIKTVYKIKDIESIRLFSKTNKLVLYFKNEKYTVISVKPEWFNDFIREVLSHNLNIRSDASTRDKDEAEKNGTALGADIKRAPAQKARAPSLICRQTKLHSSIRTGMVTIHKTVVISVVQAAVSVSPP